MPAEIARIFIPVVVTILVFFLGQFISWSVRKNEKRQEVKVYKGLISEWIYLLKKPIDDQIKRCNDFADKVGSSQDLQPEVFEINKFLAEKVLSISIEKYINSFVINTSGDKNENYKMTYNIISQLNFLTLNENEIPKIYDKYQRQTFEIMDEWNAAFRKLDYLISNQTKLLGKDPHHYSAGFHKEVLAIANLWHQTSPNGRSSVKHSDENLIRPIDILIKKELASNPANDYAYDLSTCLQELRISLLKWNSLNAGNKVLFNRLADTLRLSSESLIKSVTYFKERTNTKCVFRIK